jgi:hypothetical protein
MVRRSRKIFWIADEIIVYVEMVRIVATAWIVPVKQKNEKVYTGYIWTAAIVLFQMPLETARFVLRQAIC